jgi:ElaB/YqjD/DUF883 family membrane-anchored ribosome-binding protein
MEPTEQAANRLNDIAAVSQDTVQEGAAVVKEKAEEMKAKATHVKERLVAAGEQAAHTVADPDKRKAAQSSAERWIRENPWTATAIAFAVGLRLGRGFRRR